MLSPRRAAVLAQAVRVTGLAGLLALIAVLALFGARSALSSPPPALLMSPAELKLTAGIDTAFTIDVVIDGVTDLGAFEFTIISDPAFVKLVDVRLGPFLGSNARVVTCREQAPAAGIAEFGCNTVNPAPPGPSGSGVVAHLDFVLQGHSFGETILQLRSCNAANVLGVSILSGTCKHTNLTVNAATPTATPNPRVRKLPTLQNLFLTRQGVKIPPVQCSGPQSSDDAALFAETLSAAITSPDPKAPARRQELGAFEFEVRFDRKKVCVELRPGRAAAAMICMVQDATNSQLEGVARIACVTIGKDGAFPDTMTTAGRHLADVVVRPQPDVYSLLKPQQDNGIIIDLIDAKCELADAQGHPIKLLSCDDAKLIIRYLEGDVAPDCSVDTLDTQSIAFRWGATKGTLLYNDRFNLEPSGLPADNDIDIKDLQFVYGRFGSSCQHPHPPQQATPDSKHTATPTPTATPPDTTKPRINKSPSHVELTLTSRPQECADGPDAAVLEIIIKDSITSPDPKTPTQLQQLGGFEFRTRFDPSVVCVEVEAGSIPLGEMTCFTIAGDGLVRFGCTTASAQNPPFPQPPGVLARIIVRPRPDVYNLLFPAAEDQLITQLFNENCQLSDLLGHVIKTFALDCGAATIAIHYP